MRTNFGWEGKGRYGSFRDVQVKLQDSAFRGVFTVHDEAL